MNKAIEILPEPGRQLHLMVFGRFGFTGYYDGGLNLFYVDMAVSGPAYYGPLVIEWIYKSKHNEKEK